MRGEKKPGRVNDHKIQLQRLLLYGMERGALLSGYYKALASSPCLFCAACLAEERLEMGESPSRTARAAA
jgi:hypothetical protein